MSDGVTWRTVATLRCGCHLIVLDGFATGVRADGSCVYHQCRLCGAQPAIDAEPDRLCVACMTRAREGLRP